MRVTARFFASARDAVGQSCVDVEVEEGASVAALFQRLTSDYPKLAGYAHFLMAAVNAEYADFQRPLSPGDEVAFIPPVSGGAGV